MQQDHRKASAIAVSAWHARLSGASLTRTLDGGRGGALRRFRDIAGDLNQPPLRENVIAVHLGGPKQVTRSQGRRSARFEVAENTITLMPAFEPFRWSTEGPVEFAHLVLPDAFLRRIAVEEFDREPGTLRLEPVVGVGGDFAGRLFGTLLSELELPQGGRLYRDSLLMVLSCTLLRRFSSLRSHAGGQVTPVGAAKGGLAGWQLRRIGDYMRANLAEDVALSTLIGLTGLSRAQFFKAFHQSTGRSPVAYLTDLRIQRACDLLAGSDLTVAGVALAVGFDAGRLGVLFRKHVGMTALAYRREFRRR